MYVRHVRMERMQNAYEKNNNSKNQTNTVATFTYVSAALCFLVAKKCN